jgi:hypothetical protein
MIMDLQINKNIALVELGGSHTECMHLQIKALKESGYNVFIICNSSLFDDFPDKHLFDGYQLHQIEHSIKSQIKCILKTRQFFKRNRITSAVFNTSEINIVRNLLLFPLPAVTNYVGIVHNGKYLESSTSCKIVSRRVRKYFVLSRTIRDCLNIKLNVKVDAFYPIYFPEYPKADLPDKKSGELWITVPGSISPDRKELDSLLTSIENTALDKSVHLILLGKIHGDKYPELAGRISSLSKSNNIVMFDSRVPDDIFSSYMNLSDIVMPLIHADTYGNCRISGSYNLAYGYKIPLYMEQKLSHFPDFKNIALFYDQSQNIAAQINTLAGNREELSKCRENLLSHPIYNTAAQCKHYIDLITYHENRI